MVVTTCNTVTVPPSYGCCLCSLTLQLLNERPGHAGATGVKDNVSLWGGMEMGVRDLSGGRTTSPEGCWENVFSGSFGEAHRDTLDGCLQGTSTTTLKVEGLGTWETLLRRR